MFSLRFLICLLGGVGLTTLGLLPATSQGQALAQVAKPNAPTTAAKSSRPTTAPPASQTAAPAAASSPAPLSVQAAITRDSIYADPPVAAEFPGGMPALGAYIGANMRFPQEARTKGITGRVLVQFVLDKRGRVQDAHVLSGPGAGLNEEAYRLVWLMPPWEPGRLANGEPVRVNCTLPISFRPPPDTEATNGVYGTKPKD